MPRYMLDTDTASYLIKNKVPSVRARFAELDPSQVMISSIVRMELQFGLKKLPALHPMQRRTAVFLNEVPVIAWDEIAADVCAEIRYRMRVEGTSLPDCDTMIAAHAIAIGATLVTNNTRHHGRFQPTLRIENWVTDS